MPNPNGNLDTLKMFSSTYQPKNKGPKRSKLRSFIRENDLGSFDIQVIAKQLLDLSREQMEELARDKTKPILLTGAATALLKDMVKGGTTTIQWLADRGFGLTKQTVETKNFNFSPVDLSPEERSKLLDEYYQNRRANENDTDQMSGSDNPADRRDTGVPREAEKAQQEKP